MMQVDKVKNFDSIQLWATLTVIKDVSIADHTFSLGKWGQDNHTGVPTHLSTPLLGEKPLSD